MNMKQIDDCTPVALYARVSSDRQDVDLSVAAQLRALRDYAEKNGYTVAREYVDEAESGRIADRPQFRKMLDEASKTTSPFHEILVWKFSRFTRKREHAVAFKSMLGMVGIRHILATPFHPQTNGKLERYHQTLKRDVNQLPYEMPSDLEAAIVAFVSYYNYRRYHKALGNVTPSDVLKGRRQEILRRRKEVQAQTIERRRQHNRAIRKLTRPLSDP